MPRSFCYSLFSTHQKEESRWKIDREQYRTVFIKKNCIITERILGDIKTIDNSISFKFPYRVALKVFVDSSVFRVASKNVIQNRDLTAREKLYNATTHNFDTPSSPKITEKKNYIHPTQPKIFTARLVTPVTRDAWCVCVCVSKVTVAFRNNETKETAPFAQKKTPISTRDEYKITVQSSAAKKKKLRLINRYIQWTLEGDKSHSLLTCIAIL